MKSALKQRIDFSLLITLVSALVGAAAFRSVTAWAAPQDGIRQSQERAEHTAHSQKGNMAGDADAKTPKLLIEVFDTLADGSIDGNKAGKLMTQAVTGGPSSPATSSDHMFWQSRQKAESPNLSSDDGHFKALEISGSLDGAAKFRIVALTQKNGFAGDNSVAVSQEQIAKAIRARSKNLEVENITFQGWITGTDYFIAKSTYHIQEINTLTRSIIDARTGKMIAFNGWLGPDGHTAVITSEDYLAHDRNESVSHFEGNIHVFVPKSDVRPDFYLSTLQGNIGDYTFAAASKRKITCEGKGVRLGLLTKYTFSGDGKWLVCNTYDNGSYVVNTATGAARALPKGTFARCCLTP